MPDPTQRLPEQMIATWLPRADEIWMYGTLVTGLDRESLLSAIAYLVDQEKATRAELSRRTRLLLHQDSGERDA